MPDALLKTAAARKPLAELEQHDAFLERHIGPDSDEQAQMLSLLGYATRAALIDAVVPAGIRSKTALDWAVEHQMKVDVVCPFVAEYLHKHPEYSHLLMR